mgnify:CR=1 FL=1
MMDTLKIFSEIYNSNDLEGLKKSKQILQDVLMAVNNRIDELEHEKLRMELRYLIKTVAMK